MACELYYNKPIWGGKKQRRLVQSESGLVYLLDYERRLFLALIFMSDVVSWHVE